MWLLMIENTTINKGDYCGTKKKKKKKEKKIFVFVDVFAVKHKRS